MSPAPPGATHEPSDVDSRKAGVIFGNIVLPVESVAGWSRDVLACGLLEKMGLPAELPQPLEPLNAFPAGLPAAIVARALGLSGPAYTIDAACATSLYSIALAAAELEAGRADVMLCGGVSRPDALYIQMGFSQLRALSARGRSAPFDASADGLVAAEGAGMFVLKRLDDALAHGDRIYALVAGAGLSNDSRGDLLAPSSEGQLRAMRQAYQEAGWNPADVDLIECHATGAPVGDAVEVESLKTLWGEHGWAAHQCAIGSVKSNIGHALTAAGAAGLLEGYPRIKEPQLAPHGQLQTRFSQAGPRQRSVPRSQGKRALACPPPRPAAPRRRQRLRLRRYQCSRSDRGMGRCPPEHREVDVPSRPARRQIRGGTRRFADCNRRLRRTVRPVPGVASLQTTRAARRSRVLPPRRRETGGALPKPHGFEAWVTIRADFLGFFIEQLEFRVDQFRIPPRELGEMLPQQSLMLRVAAEALADARWDDRLAISTGVLIGIGLDLSTTNYHLRWSLESLLGKSRKALKPGINPLARCTDRRAEKRRCPRPLGQPDHRLPGRHGRQPGRARKSDRRSQFHSVM